MFTVWFCFTVGNWLHVHCGVSGSAHTEFIVRLSFYSCDRHPCP